MKPEEIRIAIAEACGLKIDNEPNKHDCRLIGWKGAVPTVVPDYLNDLNACHEMEKVLSAQQKVDFTLVLHAEVLGKAWPEHQQQLPAMMFSTIHATSTQRCEAFLKTLGLWKDES